MPSPVNDQQEWFKLCAEHGEAGANAFLVKQLRWAADQIESGKYPRVFGCHLEKATGLPMITISVTLSDVWPG